MKKLITLSIILFALLSFEAKAQDYSRADHLDSIAGYYFAIIDTAKMDTAYIDVRYCEWNWSYKPEKLFIWEMGKRRHERALGISNDYICDEFLYSNPILKRRY